MKTGRFFTAAVLALVSILGFSAGDLTAKEKFPVKPIQVIIPFQPGDTDNQFRPFVEKMPEYLGQPVSLQYKPGGAGATGAGFVAAAKPDGYTILGCAQAALVIVPATRKDLGYTWRSFEQIGCAVEGGGLIVTPANSPWKTIQDLVADAKKNPGQLTFSSSGTFAQPHLTFEAFCEQAGIQLNHIPSQGSGPAVTAVLGGHVNFTSTALTPALPHLKAGTLRGLAVWSEKRIPSIPDVPTFLELGYSVVGSGFYGLNAPKGTPKEVIDAIYLAMKKVLENHNAFIVDRLDKLGTQVCLRGPAEYSALLKSQDELFSHIIKKVLK